MEERKSCFLIELEVKKTDGLHHESVSGSREWLSVRASGRRILANVWKGELEEEK